MAAFPGPAAFTEAAAAARAHAVAEWPREACGVVVGRCAPVLDGDAGRGAAVLDGGASRYIPVRNIAPDPESHFLMQRDAWVRFGAVEAVLHSHCVPRAQRAPSAADMAGQIETAVPWGVILTDSREASEPLWWGDFRLEEHLVGRSYLWGVLDCWSLVRAWHWQRRGVRLRDFPRDEGEFRAGGDLFRRHAAAAGLVPIAETEVEPGDVAFLRIRGDVPNHCAVAEEGGVILHHLAGRLSCRQPAGMWRRHIVQWLRHQDQLER